MSASLVGSEMCIRDSARTGEADSLDHAWLSAAAVRQWGSRVAQSLRTLVVLGARLRGRREG
eukprot:8939464-Alexandrium_andersonii.AAC.1